MDLPVPFDSSTNIFMLFFSFLIAFLSQAGPGVFVKAMLGGWEVHSEHAP